MENMKLAPEIRSGPHSNNLVGGSEGGPLLAVATTRTGTEAEELANQLRSRIVGQDEAIHQIVRTYQTYLAGLSPVGRPIGAFLFRDPVGSDTTRLVEATAECLLGDRRAVIKINCAEFQHRHQIAKLIGSTPGCPGHSKTRPALSQEALNRYHTGKVKVSLVLFEGIEKASDALWNLMTGILDNATLTLSDNQRVDFSQAMIFMTSNLGAAEMNSMLRQKSGTGDCFLRNATDMRNDARPLKCAIKRQVTQHFSNLIVTGQIRNGDRIRVTRSAPAPMLTFSRVAEGFRSWEVQRAAA